MSAYFLRTLCDQASAPRAETSQHLLASRARRRLAVLARRRASRTLVTPWSRVAHCRSRRYRLLRILTQEEEASEGGASQCVLPDKASTMNDRRCCHCHRRVDGRCLPKKVAKTTMEKEGRGRTNPGATAPRACPDEPGVVHDGCNVPW